MLDHISIPVKDLQAAANFYELTLSEIGYARLVEKPATVGFGKKYPDFWLNHRPGKSESTRNDGFHVCFRAGSQEEVESFFRKAISLGAMSDGEPGLRENYSSNYFAAFVVDRDGNKIEVVTFLKSVGSA